jgi:multiple sugar transport system permease protein
MKLWKRNRHSGDKLLGWVFNLIALFIILVPFSSLVIGSIQTESSLITNTRSIFPKEVTLQNFMILIKGDTSDRRYPSQVRTFPAAFGRSAIVASATSLITVFFGSLSAYTLARLKFRGKNSFSIIVLATRMVPVIALIIPLYLTLRNFKLLNTLSGIIITEVSFLLPLTIWMLRSYFESLPAELEEAARVDGTTRMGAFARIVIPLSAPGMAATFVITFLLSWNEFLIPIIIGSSERVWTLPMLLSTFISDFNLQYTIVNSVALLSTLPTILLAIILQKYVIAGLTAGAVKG